MWVYMVPDKKLFNLLISISNLFVRVEFKVEVKIVIDNGNK